MASDNLIQVHKVSKQYGMKVLFDEASFVINSGEHIGVIGPNGAGKTTLFRILTKQNTYDEGELVFSQKTRIGYLAQEDNWDTDEVAEDLLAEQCLLPIWELKPLGLGLGLSEEHFHTPIRALSGGYRMRMKLLHLIGQEPNILLLDEPTNFLDLETLLLLESFLQNFKGAFLVISHDREFLKRTTDHTLEVENGDIIKFNGNIEDYFEQKEELRILLDKQARSQQAKRKEVMQFVERFRAKASKAKQAQSRLRSLDKMDSIEVAPLAIHANIPIPAPTHTGKETLSLRDGVLGYGDKVVLEDLDFRLMRGDHLAVVGVNGAGKSTLLKGLHGSLPFMKGELNIGYQVEFSYYAQHVSEALDPDDTVFAALQREAHPEVRQQEVKDLAGALLFRGDDLDKPIRVLSGGEKSRIALGQILLQKAPCLLLDEPTNHLDFHTVEALTAALKRYPGTLIVISHDRGFVKNIANRILEVSDGKARFYPGSYDEYVWSVQQGVFSEHAPREKSAKKVAKGPKKEKINQKVQKQKRKEADKMLSALDKDMARIKKAIEENTQDFQQARGPAVAALSQSLHALKSELAQVEAQWLEVLEEKENLSR